MHPVRFSDDDMSVHTVPAQTYPDVGPPSKGYAPMGTAFQVTYGTYVGVYPTRQLFDAVKADNSLAFAGYEDALLHREVVVPRKSIFDPIMTGVELTALLGAHGAKQHGLVLTLKLTTVEAAVKDKRGVTRNVVNIVLRRLGSSPRM
jgi:hypothetical protein